MNSSVSICAIVFFFAVSMTAPTHVFGAGLERPTGKVILTVTGNIEHTNADGRAEFDFEMLSALGLSTLVTETPWDNSSVRFQGVLAKKLMDAVGARGDSIKATALNDYSVRIPVSDFTDHPTLLATHKQGKRMRLRDKGPLWIIYSATDRPDGPNLLFEHRMVWQLDSLEIL